MAKPKAINTDIVEALMVSTLINQLPTQVSFADDEQFGWLSLNACPAGHWHAGYLQPDTGQIRGDLTSTGDTPQAALMGLSILITQHS